MSTALVDNFGRVHRDLRVSVTDRCNFRCTYCMPAEGLDWVPRADLLSFEEIERIVRVAVERFGFTSVRLTGGEPTLRARLPLLVARLSALGVEVSMTTNGATLTHCVDDLVAAGLSRINISLDSLQRDRFLALTRRDELDKVLAGIEAAHRAGLDPIKLNVVGIRGVNDDELVDFADFGRRTGVEIRFIEYMPLDADEAWSTSQVVTSDEIVARISAVHPVEAIERDHAPAERWRYLDGQGAFGVIASVTRPFCGDCDRVRLTAEGQLRACLFSTDEHDLRTLMRGGAGDDALADAMARAVGGKGPGHGIGTVNFIRPARSMSQIGG